MVWSGRTRKIFSNAIGYFCIFVFFSLTTYIVYIFYSTIAPTVFQQNYGKFIFHFIFGNWLAINIYFNYIMAWLSSPGLAKNYQNLAIQFPVCKKCSLNKPPRTHHCSWCDSCILGFDHHCPWLNNCVGFYNHRYFFQFCCFMAIGCLYAGVFGYREYQISRLGVQAFHYTDSFFMAADILESMGVNGFLTYFIFFIALVMGFLLIGLSWWHGYLIGRGETSIEHFLNKDYLDQYIEKGFPYVNINHSNRIRNWKRFLGVRTISQFIRRILLPSTHKPKGNGVTTAEFDINTNFHSHREDSGQMRRHVSYTSSIDHSIPGGYLAKKYRSIVPSWQTQSEFGSYNSSYQPQPSPTKWPHIVLDC